VRIRTSVVLPAPFATVADGAFEGTGLLMPHRNPPTAASCRPEATPERHSSAGRVRVGHTVAHLKVWSILRNRRAQRRRRPERGQRRRALMRNLAMTG
jgi:hypothetical protein